MIWLNLRCEQLCKEWLLKHTAPSHTRIATVGKYLVALSASFSASGNVKASKTPGKRQRIRILYLCNDLFHQTKFHDAALTATNGFCRTFEPYIVQLVALASYYDPLKHTQHFRNLHNLLVIWSESGYYSSALISTLRATIDNASTSNDTLTQAIRYPEETGGVEEFGDDSRRDAPYTMPASHGDTSVPFYDLPAGNLMPCIEPNSMTPINPRTVHPLRFRVGPAEERIVQAVKGLLYDADSIYGAYRSVNATEKLHINDLGQLVIHEKNSVELTVNEGYYGWSRAFCEKMKQRSRHDKLAESLHRQPSPASVSRGGRRALYSDAGRSRSSSPATSRTPTRSEGVAHVRKQRTSPDSRSRSRSTPRYLDRHGSPAFMPRARPTSLRSRSRSYSPPDVPLSEDREPVRERIVMPKLFHDELPYTVIPPQASFQRSHLDQTPVPPPPPPNNSGPWVSAGDASPWALIVLFVLGDHRPRSTKICHRRALQAHTIADSCICAAAPSPTTSVTPSHVSASNSTDPIFR